MMVKKGALDYPLGPLIKSLRNSILVSNKLADNQHLVPKDKFLTDVRAIKSKIDYRITELRIIVFLNDHPITPVSLDKKIYYHIVIGSPIFGDCGILDTMEIVSDTKDISCELLYLPASLSKAAHEGLKKETSLLLTFVCDGS